MRMYNRRQYVTTTKSSFSVAPSQHTSLGPAQQTIIALSPSVLFLRLVRIQRNSSTSRSRWYVTLSPRLPGFGLPRRPPL